MIDLIIMIILPIACRWVGSKEKLILREGEVLSNELREFAVKIGIKDPSQVRILKVDKIPLLALMPGKLAGLTLNYGIYIRKDCVASTRILKHELAHTLQYEQLGGIKGFLKKYFKEVMIFGYHQAPMELEAKSKELI